MKFDWSSCAVGLIAGVGAILCVIFAVEIDIFVDTPICAGDENGLTCARNWIDGLAIIAAAGTIFFLAREQFDARRIRHEDQHAARENAVFNSLTVMAKITTASDYGRAILANARELEKIAKKYTVGEYRNHMGVKPHPIIRHLRECDMLLQENAWSDLNEFEGSIRGKISLARFKVGDLATILYGYEAPASAVFNPMFESEFVENFRDYLCDDYFAEVLAALRSVSGTVLAFETAVREQKLTAYFAPNRVT